MSPTNCPRSWDTTQKQPQELEYHPETALGFGTPPRNCPRSWDTIHELTGSQTERERSNQAAWLPGLAPAFNGNQ